MPRVAQTKADNTMLEMAIVGYHSRNQRATRATRSGPAKSGGGGDGCSGPTEAPHHQQSRAGQDCRGTASQVGGAEAATGRTGTAQETENVGGRFESHQRSY
jgi:hypothetical protein